MKPYPKNIINYTPISPVYRRNMDEREDSRYYVYRLYDNSPKTAMEVRLTNAISKNPTFQGYYYTTVKYETLYEIANVYYGDESLYWVLAKANQLKDKSLSTLPPGTTIVIPLLSELSVTGGYFSR